MAFWRRLRYGLRSLISPGRAVRDIDDEATHYLDELARSLEARGMSREEARRAARLEMGGKIALRESVRDSQWESAVEGWFADLRQAIRGLRRNPAFALTAIATLSLGLGAVSAIFATVDAVLLRPLPYPNSERLVSLVHTAPGINLNELRMSESFYFTYREESRVFEDLANWNGNHAVVTGLGEPTNEPTLYVTCSFLDVLGVKPAIGRGFAPGDDEPGKPRTVILSDGYWRQKFGGDRSAIGRTLIANGEAREIVGVLPAGFEFMDEKISLIVPARSRREEVRLIAFGASGIARLKPGVTLEQANADVARMIPLAPAKFPINPGWAANTFTDAKIAPALRTLHGDLIGDIGKTLWVLMAAVGLLLLIAGANVANLLLVRADGRRQELAVRAALGASWNRIVRALLSESLLIGLAGGALGLAICYLALEWVRSSGFAGLPRLASVVVNESTVLFAFATGVLASLVFGLIPAWRYSRPATTDAFRSSGRGMSQSRDRRRVQRSLLVAQVALAMVLLAGAGLMLRTFLALRAVDSGFSRPEQVLAIRVSIPATLVSAPELVTRIQMDIARKLESVPGVSAVAIASAPPLEGGATHPVLVDGFDWGIAPLRRPRDVSPGWTAAIGGRLVAGRDFTWRETTEGAPVAIISENMARELWSEPGAALGKRLRRSVNQDWSEVIGVVSDLRDDGAAMAAPTLVHWPLARKERGGTLTISRHLDYLIRSPRTGSAAFLAELGQALRSVNGNLPLANVRTLDAIYRKSMARTSFALALLGIAGAMALVLGVVGIYGVVAYSVAQRRRDIGIRIALGATLQGVTQMFVREGLAVSVIGAAMGLLAALAVTRLMQTLLFGVAPADPLTYGLAFVCLLAASALASWLPARRAARVDPAEALRAE
ncbi:MAG: ABC transporter permease [Bryobacteraceae bacterium]|nr:ABC transporter permease [Bryobacteraceae bacterium]